MSKYRVAAIQLRYQNRLQAKKGGPALKSPKELCKGRLLLYTVQLCLTCVYGIQAIAEHLLDFMYL